MPARVGREGKMTVTLTYPRRGFRVMRTEVRALLVSSCVIQGKLFKLFKPQLHHRYDGDNNRVAIELKEIMCREHGVLGLMLSHK